MQYSAKFQGAKLSWLATVEIFAEITFTSLSFSCYLPNRSQIFSWYTNFVLQCSFLKNAKVINNKFLANSPIYGMCAFLYMYVSSIF